MKAQFLMLCVLVELVSSEGAFAAKCNYRQDTDDFFNGVLTVRTKWDEIAATSLGNSDDLPSQVRQVLGIVSAVHESGTPRLEFKLRFITRSTFLPAQSELDAAFYIPQGATLEITLADGTSVELPALLPVKAWTNILYPYAAGNDDYYTYVHATIQYVLNESTMNALGAQSASAVRVHGEGNYKDVTVPKKGSKHLKEAVACLQQGITA